MSYIERIVNDHPITTAQSIATVSGANLKIPVAASALTIEANLTVVGGGTTTKCYIQTSLDGGITWIDIMCFAFTTSSLRSVMTVLSEAIQLTPVTPTVGTLADDTAINGIIGREIRAQVVTTGTYTGATQLDVRMKVMIK